MPYKDPEMRRECARKWARKSRADNPERERAAKLKYREANREKERDYATARYAADPVKARAIAAAYRARHPDKVKAATETYRRANQKKVRQGYREYNTTKRRALSPDKAKEYHRNKTARRKGAEGKVSAADERAQYTRQKGLCFWCGKVVGKTYHVDHVIPLIKGGTNHPTNIVIACPTCNCSKGPKMPEVFAGRLL
jgi:5-methylcytosine-specific restriction endonuclease McrA